MPKVEFAEEARADLRAILGYTIEHWGKAQARRYVNDLRNTCTEVAAMPGLGRESQWAGPGIRSFPSQSHVIYYRPAPDGILVLAVIHKRQDPKRHVQP